MTIEAQLNGVCPECDGRIRPGERITRYDVTDPWRHAVCPESTSLDFDPTTVCQSCFTVRAVNGACACPK